MAPFIPQFRPISKKQVPYCLNYFNDSRTKMIAQVSGKQVLNNVLIGLQSLLWVVDTHVSY